jgi:hypothetical protein
MPGASLGAPAHRRLAHALDAPSSSDSKFQTANVPDVIARLAAFAKTSAGLTLSTSSRREVGPITTGVCRRNDSAMIAVPASHTTDICGYRFPVRRSLSLACPGRRRGARFDFQTTKRMCVRIPAAGSVRALLKQCPSKIRAQGMPGARRTQGRVCNTRDNNHRYTAINRHSLRDGINSLLRALSGGRAPLPPSLAR